MNDQVTTLLLLATMYVAYLLAIGFIVLEATAIVLGLGMALRDLVACARRSGRLPVGLERWAHR